MFWFVALEWLQTSHGDVCKDKQVTGMLITGSYLYIKAVTKCLTLSPMTYLQLQDPTLNCYLRGLLSSPDTNAHPLFVPPWLISTCEKALQQKQSTHSQRLS